MTPISPNETSSKTTTTSAERAQAIKDSGVNAISPISSVGSSDTSTSGNSTVTTGSASRLSLDLISLLSDSNLSSIKLMLPLLKEATSILRDLNSYTALSSDNRLLAQLKNLIDILIQGGVVIDEKSIANPEQLAKLLQAFADPKVRDILDSIKRELATQLSEFPNFTGRNPTEISNLRDVAKLIEQLDLLNHAQTNLAQLNVIMNALGEPSLFMFAALMGGFLTRIKFTHDPVKDEDKNKEGKDARFTNLNLEVNLPGLGIVGVNLGYKDKEILLRLHLANNDLVNFVRPRIQSLRGKLFEAGYIIKELDLTTEPAKPIEPGWVASVMDQNRAVA